MPKFVNSITLVTQPAASTPAGGFGTVYASGSNLYFLTDSGSLFNLTSPPIIREYTGSSTWNKPDGVKEILVFIAGAGGGGGGAGRRFGAISGASGGGGGAMRWLRLPSRSLS